MRDADVAVIGGGSGGSLTAAMLGRAGISTVLIDLHETPPREFRCEKLHHDQVELLEKTGLAERVLASLTPIPLVWVARYGRLIAKLSLHEYGFYYDGVIKAFRDQIPNAVFIVHGKVADLKNTQDRQTITLTNGDIWSVRLVVMATGLNNVLHGIERQEISKTHSIAIGWDLASRDGFSFPALTYHIGTGRSGYLSMFPIGQTMRANFFCYHDFRDPWLKQFRAAPMATIFEASPRLRRFLPGTAEVISDVRVRPTDLYVARNHEQPGVVLIGDNFSTSCPAAGTGLNKVLTDVERLCNHYIPVWLASPRMGVDKIHRYYQDPIKRDCDKYSTRLAFYTRSVSIDTTFPWRMRRLLGTGLTIKGHFQKQPA